LQKQHGPMFWLLYMNSVGDSALVDFNGADLREFELRDGLVWLHEDDRDVTLASQMRSTTGPTTEPPAGGRGMTLDQYLDWQDQHRASGRVEAQRLNYIKGARGRDVPLPRPEAPRR